MALQAAMGAGDSIVNLRVQQAGSEERGGGQGTVPRAAGRTLRQQRPKAPMTAIIAVALHRIRTSHQGSASLEARAANPGSVEPARTAGPTENGGERHADITDK